VAPAQFKVKLEIVPNDQGKGTHVGDWRPLRPFCKSTHSPQTQRQVITRGFQF
jgi:hypothetical protein